MDAPPISKSKTIDHRVRIYPSSDHASSPINNPAATATRIFVHVPRPRGSARAESSFMRPLGAPSPEWQGSHSYPLVEGLGLTVLDAVALGVAVAFGLTTPFGLAVDLDVAVGFGVTFGVTTGLGSVVHPGSTVSRIASVIGFTTTVAVVKTIGGQVFFFLGQTVGALNVPA